MEETIEDMDKEIELKDNTFIFLTDKVGNLKEEFMNQMEKVKKCEILEKIDRVDKTFDEALQKH